MRDPESGGTPLASGRSARSVVVVLLGLAVAAVCARLGLWQLDRLQERRERNAALRQALSLPPLPLPDSLSAVFGHPERYVFRRAVVDGVYDPAGELILRGRTAEGRPGVHLVTPLRVAGDTVLLVNRGWAPSPDAATIDPRPLSEPGERRVEGILLAAPATGDPSPVWIETGGARFLSFSRLALDSLRRAAVRPLAPLYLQQSPTAMDAPLPRRVPLPELSEGSHRGYAIQWFSFALIALLGGALLGWRGRTRQG